MKSMDRSFRKNLDYYIIFGLAALVYIMSVGTDFTEYSQHQDINIPTWFFYPIFGLDAVVIIAFVLVFLFRKIGVIALPIAVFIHFLMHQYYLNTYLYSDVTTLFLFIGLGLVAIIPRWKYLK